MMFLAIRYLFSKKRQSLLTLMGIVLGTAGYVVISGIMLGFQTFLIDQFINNDAHIRIQARDEPVLENQVREDLFGSIENDSHRIHWVTAPSGRRTEETIQNLPGWTDRLKADSRVEAFAYQLQFPVLTELGKQSLSTRVIGMIPKDQLQVSSLETYMVHGSFLDLARSNGGVIVGTGMLDKLGASVGDLIFLTKGMDNSVPFKILGSFKFGIKAIDEGTIYMNLSDAQSLSKAPSRVSDIVVRLHDVDLASSFSKELGEKSSEKVQSWEELNENMLSVFKTQDIVRYSMTLTILIVAGFGIFNVLSMMVAQKRREIAILRSVGYEPAQVTQLFLIQGGILGGLGGTLGMLVGGFICMYLATIEVSPGRALGLGKMMISFEPKIYLLGFSIAFFSALFSSLLPARAAGKMNPMDIMRSES